MAGVYKRASDRKRGPAGKWTMVWIDARGKRVKRVGLSDKNESLRVARKLEDDARLEREGLALPSVTAIRRAHTQPLCAHIGAYRGFLEGKGDTPKHCRDTASLIRSLLEASSTSAIHDVSAARVQNALGVWLQTKSARRCNAALAAVKAFCRWAFDDKRLAEVPAGLIRLRPFNQTLRPTLVRRAATKEEITRLLDATERGVPRVASRGALRGPRPKVWISGPERAALYRLALGTGFRANELRSLTPEHFHLEGSEPWIGLGASVAKNRKKVEQPITRELARALRRFLKGRAPGEPAVVVPSKTARMLRHDLEAAGIPVETRDGLLDFHALRASYITHLVADGVNPAIVQKLARHSSITLTMNLYAKTSRADLWAALEKAG